MSLIPTTIKNSFIQLTPPVAPGSCVVPQICLPVVNPADLAFQVTMYATQADFQYLLQINEPASFVASCVDTTLTVSAITSIAFIFVGDEIKAGGISYGTITAQLSGTQGGVGTYIVSNGNLFTNLNMVTVGTGVLGKIGALVVGEGQTAPTALPFGIADFICTGAAPTGNTKIIDQVTCAEWVLFFQFGSVPSPYNWDELAAGSCFNLQFYEIQYVNESVGWVYTSSSLTSLSTFTCFTKIDDDCDGWPTSVLQYANNSNAFGFYYDALGQLVDNINFLNSVRLPIYLHSPEQAEDQVSYQKSDGSTLKLSHRIWTDYKLKTDYLTTDMHRALVAATAHDLVFITSALAGLNPWVDDNGNAVPYSFTNTQTQLVRTEKIEVEWLQETIPRYKLGQAKGTLRLALAELNVNTNCG